MAFLAIQEKGYADFLRNIRDEEVTKTLTVTCDDEDSITTIYQALKADALLPEVNNAALSNKEYAGLYWNNGNGDKLLYTPYGRLFSRVEMDTAAPVALVSTGYLRRLPKEKLRDVWEEGIWIRGTHYSAIGEYHLDWQSDKPSGQDFYGASTAPATVSVPVETFIAHSFPASEMRYVFNESLSEDQIQRLKNILDSYGHVIVVSLPSLRNDSALNAFITSSIAYSLVILLSFINVVSISMHWIRESFNRYSVYSICGAKRAQIRFFISLNMFIMVTIGGWFAYYSLSLIRNHTPAGVLEELPSGFYLSFYIAAILFFLIAANIKAFPEYFEAGYRINKKRARP